ncbi:hypothetical protein ABH897_005600 [Paenibacillus sp. RC73]
MTTVEIFSQAAQWMLYVTPALLGFTGILFADQIVAELYRILGRAHRHYR